MKLTSELEVDDGLETTLAKIIHSDYLPIMGFDTDSAKEYLKKREQAEKEQNEKIRLELLEKTIAAIKEDFDEKGVQVFLVGSIILSNQFTRNSDIDVVLKNFNGDRFALMARWENRLGRSVEVILYENCPFQQHVEKYGFKVI